MAEGVGIPLENHLAGFVQREREASQPADHPPDEAVIDDGLMERITFRRCLVRGSLRVLGRSDLNRISDALSVMRYGLSIADFLIVYLIPIGIFPLRIPEEAFGGPDQAGGGETLIRQHETRGSQ